jgi:hypothetical protein
MIEQITAGLTREECEELLESVSIRCGPDEAIEELRAAVECNVEDGTITDENFQRVTGYDLSDMD